MRIIRTHEVNPETLSQWERDQTYNGLDVCVTHDVYNEIHHHLDNTTAATYEFSRSLQGPVLDMQYRGVLVDQARKEQVINKFLDQIDRLERNLDRIVLDGVGMPYFNWRSPKDQQSLFYDHLGLPVQRKLGRPTTDRAAREKLGAYFIAEQIVNHINLLADLQKKVSVLRTGIDNDGRIRTSYNIAGTSTGRFSSSMSEFGTGTNLQNIEESLRSMFIADPGMKFAKLDAKSGESFCVGAIEWNLFNDGRYLDACETGDPHTAVARICWPGLPWTGELTQDKDIADRDYYRHYTYRFMCKKLGHGSNYGGQPETLAQQTRCPIELVQGFQPKYFTAFPSHQRWHEHVDQTLRRDGHLITLTGRKRWFFGRRDDPKVFREALAYDPQGSLADIVNMAMLRLWRQGYTVVMHDHDALTFTYPEEQEDEIIPQIMDNIVVPIALSHGRDLRIPYDCVVGWNKGNYCCGASPKCKDCRRDSNPNGLCAYTGHDNRTRQAEVGIMDIRVRRANARA